MSSTTKKQNRVLYVTLIVLLVCAALLLIITGNASKKEQEENPGLPHNEVQNDRENDPSSSAQKQDGQDTESTGLFDNDEKDTTPNETNIPQKTDDPSEKTDLETEEIIPTVVIPTLPSFISPITDGYLMKEHSVTVPVFSITMEDYRTHTGIDIGCAPASPVLAAADGKIGNFWHDPMMGYSLSVIHDGGAVTIYQGIAEELPEGIESGKAVTAGQVIACSGNTALIECAEGDHVHFMLQIDGKQVDPTEYLALPTMANVYEN